MESPSPSRIRLTLPVTVLMERYIVSRRFWSVPNWKLAGVLAGEDVSHEAGDGRKLRDLADGGELWSWSGYRVTLYKDACERYWHALVGDKPLVYVICRESPDEGTPLRPFVVTIDYDEATAFAETDELVLSAPIPGDLYRYMEAFVLEHYRPQKFEKRKRRDWAAEGGATGGKAGGGNAAGSGTAEGGMPGGEAPGGKTGGGEAAGNGAAGNGASGGGTNDGKRRH